jgi:hypothetical protein
LVKVIADSGIARVQFRIPHDDFDVAIKSKLRYWLANGEINDEGVKRLDNPYLFAFYSNLLGVLRAIRNHESVKLDVSYDCNGEHLERLENTYQEFLQSKIADEVKAMLSKARLPRDDNTFMPLQAADLLEWHTHRFRRIEEKQYPLGCGLVRTERPAQSGR